jgi:ABC-type transport system involved in multi-copper enzyme maturation permease subunit
MRWFAKQVWFVLRYELADSIRSRRVLILLLLYLAGALLASNGYITAIHKLEAQLAETLSLPPASSPGAVSEALWGSTAFRRMMISLVGDKEIALDLLSLPPIAMIYGWLAFTFTPMLVVLSAAGRIAEEVSSGSVRYVLSRTSRPAWCLGKYCGQACEVLLALMLSAIVTWCVARFRMPQSNGFETARWIIIYGWKAWLYSLAFIGLALGMSQAIRSPHHAMGLTLGLLIAMGILSLMSHHLAGEGWSQLWQITDYLFPMKQKLNLWRLQPAYIANAGVYLVTLSMAYLFAGYAVFTRRGA